MSVAMKLDDDESAKREFKIFRPVLRFLARPIMRVPPNLVTLCALILVLPMAVLFWTGHLLAASIIYAISMLADALDGHIARAQEAQKKASRTGIVDIGCRRAVLANKSAHVLLQRGETAFGTEFDPLVDKIRYAAALLPLACLGMPWPWPLTLIVALVPLGVAVALTRLRGQANSVYPAISLPSNIYGKVKVWFEIATIAALVGHTADADIKWGPVVLCVLFTVFLALAGKRRRKNAHNDSSMLLGLIGGACLYGSILVWYIGWIGTVLGAFLVATTLGVISLSKQRKAYKAQLAAR